MADVPHDIKRLLAAKFCSESLQPYFCKVLYTLRDDVLLLLGQLLASANTMKGKKENENNAK